MWQKIGNGWKLLLTVVTLSFVLNVTGLLDRTLKLIDEFRLRQSKVFYLPFRSLDQHVNKTNIFKVSNEDTRTICSASIANFQQISHFFLLSILLNLHKKKCLLGLRNGSFRQCVFSNWEKYIVLWAGKIYLAICFHSCPTLQKDKFSRWHFKKISRTLAGNKCNTYIQTKYKVCNHFITEDMLNAVLIFFYKDLVFFRFVYE